MAQCVGCERDWNDWNSPEGGCIKKVKLASECASPKKFFAAKSDALTGAGICYDADKSRSDCNTGWEFLECYENVDAAACKATAASGWAAPMEKVSQEMKCKVTAYGKCKNKQDCESQGMCTMNMDLMAASSGGDMFMDPMMMMGGMGGMGGPGGMGMGIPKEVFGPASGLTDLKDTSSDSSGQQQQDDAFMMMDCLPWDKYTTPYFYENTCKVDMSEAEVDDPTNPCGVDTNLNRVEIDKCSGQVHDPFTVYTGEACYHYLIPQSECTGTGKSWVATGETKETCEGKKLCMGGDGYDTSQRGKKECIACNGVYGLANKWVTNDFAVSKLTNVTGEWVSRAVAPVNKLQVMMEKEAFMRKMMEVKRQLEGEEENQAMMCYWGRTATQLATIASICEKDQAAVHQAAAVDDKNLYTTANQNQLGGEEEAQVKVGKGTFNATQSGQMRKQVGMSTEAIRAEVPGITDAIAKAAASSRQLYAASGELVEVVPSAMQLPRGAVRSLEEIQTELRYLSAAGATVNDASCYSMVKNAAGKLVGQLTGDCFAMKTADGSGTDGSAEFCLTEKDEIKKSTLYTVSDFAVRAGTAGSYTYAPAGMSVRKNGKKVCASVSNANTFYCPAMVASNAATATADIGSASCPALKAKIDAVSAAAQMAGGAAIPGAAVASTSSNATAQTEPEGLGAGTRVSSEVEFGFNMPAGVQETQLMDLLGGPFRSGIAKAAGSSINETWVTVQEIKFKTRRELEAVGAKARKLTTTARTLTVQYSIFIPSSVAGSASLAAALAQKMTAGSGTSAAFASALQTQVTAAVNSKGLVGFQVTGVVVTGTATSTSVGGSSSDDDDMDWATIGMIGGGAVGGLCFCGALAACFMMGMNRKEEKLAPAS
mmetsp:Transcript_25205/g.63426  ORF Transcript_25205/g.63426 Transcript_25205/m.63426 type:complete len:883 (-) Transcript_25205:1385-4033(-)